MILKSIITWSEMGKQPPQAIILQLNGSFCHSGITRCIALLRNVWACWAYYQSHIILSASSDLITTNTLYRVTTPPQDSLCY